MPETGGGQPIIRSVRDLPIEGRSVFMRLDFNVPVADGKVEDDSRITAALPTIQHAIERGAKLVLASHFGRPQGRRDPASSLEPVAAHLARLLAREVTLADDCVGEGIDLMARNLRGGQVLLLENLRFHAGEEANDPDFVRMLARLCDVYVTDAFGTAHRKHASTYGLPAQTPLRGMGFLIEKELRYLDPLLEAPARPFHAVLGGSKVSDKICAIESLLQRLDGLVIGGAMAHAFWAVQGEKVPEGARQPKPQDIEAARRVLLVAKRREIPVLLPTDTNRGFDIGPNTVERFAAFLASARSVFWNGPLGWFEKPEYATGTLEIARRLAELDAIIVVGGGDTVSAVRQAGVAEKYDHLSTGGGAVLEYLEGEGLPGIEVLKTYPRRNPESPTLN